MQRSIEGEETSIANLSACGKRCRGPVPGLDADCSWPILVFTGAEWKGYALGQKRLAWESAVLGAPLRLHCYSVLRRMPLDDRGRCHVTRECGRCSASSRTAIYHSIPWATREQLRMATDAAKVQSKQVGCSVRQVKIPTTTVPVCL
jgi:hypothetical protein